MNNNLSKHWDNIHLQYNSTYDGWLDKYIKLFNKDDVILELGCGRAYCSKYLFDNGYKYVIASDFSEVALKIVTRDNQDIKTMAIDISKPLPFASNFINIMIADLSLHYFDDLTTRKILNEIYRVLSIGGYLIARVNSVNTLLTIPQEYNELGKNFYYDGKMYKRFFSKEDFDILFEKFKFYSLSEKKMDRYAKTKILWEFCVRK